MLGRIACKGNGTLLYSYFYNKLETRLLNTKYSMRVLSYMIF